MALAGFEPTIPAGEELHTHALTLSNPIFVPTAYTPAIICLGGKEVVGLLVIILQF
jgi:hypothetical protein